jgi:hypothetical protein
MGGSCGTYGEDRKVYRDLLGKPEGKRPLVRRVRRWEYNIKEDLEEMVSSGSACGQVMGSFAKDNELYGSIKYLEFLDYLRTDCLRKKHFAPLN